MQRDSFRLVQMRPMPTTVVGLFGPPLLLLGSPALEALFAVQPSPRGRHGRERWLVSRRKFDGWRMTEWQA
jgi:cytochrome c oxidase assembly factor CtaG